MNLNDKAKDNISRLWKSKEIRNHDLAFKMLDGFQLHTTDVIWLWEKYHSFQKKNTRRTTLINFPNISDEEILKGKILDKILSSEHLIIPEMNHFISSNQIRLPYCTIEYIPKSLHHFKNDIQSIIWQDGEVKILDENIILFQGLKRLDLRRQPIEFIHPNIAELPALEEVYLISTSFIPEELSERHDIEIYTDAPY